MNQVKDNIRLDQKGYDSIFSGQEEDEELKAETENKLQSLDYLASLISKPSIFDEVKSFISKKGFYAEQASQKKIADALKSNWDDIDPDHYLSIIQILAKLNIQSNIPIVGTLSQREVFPENTFKGVKDESYIEKCRLTINKFKEQNPNKLIPPNLILMVLEPSIGNDYTPPKIICMGENP